MIASDAGEEALKTAASGTEISGIEICLVEREEAADPNGEGGHPFPPGIR